MVIESFQSRPVWLFGLSVRSADRFCVPVQFHYGAASSSFDILTMLYAAATRYAHNPARLLPRYRVFRNPPTVFIHPKISSTFLRHLWLIAYPSCRVVRSSTFEPRRSVMFWAMCGVTPSLLSFSTRAAVS